MVAERGGRVAVGVQPPRVRLMQGVTGVAQVLARGDPLPRFDALYPGLRLYRPHDWSDVLADIRRDLTTFVASTVPKPGGGARGN
jgi:hypothetical protein